MSSRLIASALTLILGFSIWLPAAEPIRWPLTELPKLPIAAFDLAKLQREFPAFQHTAFDQSGVFPLMLPFHFSSPDASAAPEIASAVSFLVSGDLDWMPGNYCSRHAYFVFKRSPVAMLALRTAYTPGVIALEIRNWAATHAVGGRVICSKAGYTGELLIFDRTGKQVFKKTYDRPVGLWQFISNLDCDAMTFWGNPPGAKLRAFLAEERCKNIQSMIDLGRMGFAVQRSDREFGVYEEILRRDPDFAEVRFWLANQRWWRDSKSDEFELDKNKSLASHLTNAGLLDVVPENCPDLSLRAEFPKWLAHAEQLVGVDHPMMLTIRLNLARASNQYDGALLKRALQACRRYPNEYQLLGAVAKCLSKGRAWPIDVDMAISLRLAQEVSPFTPGQGKGNCTESLAGHFLELGRPDLAAASLLHGPGHEDISEYAYLVEALAQCGQYAQAAELAAGMPPQPDMQKVNRQAMLCWGVFAAAMSGNRPVMDGLLEKCRKEFADAPGLLGALNSSADYCDGKTVNFPELIEKMRAEGLATDPAVVALLLLGQVDLTQGNNELHDMILQQLWGSPRVRPLWQLAGAYGQRSSSFLDLGFYEAVQWLYPHDPWAQSFSLPANLHKPVAIPIESIRESLMAMPTDRYPHVDHPTEAQLKGPVLPVWTLAAIVRYAMEQGQHELAREVLLRYNAQSQIAGGYTSSVLSNHLLYLDDALPTTNAVKGTVENMH